MLAAALCAEGEGDPPPELALYWKTQGFGVLPSAGGLEDQPAGLLDRMTVAANVYSAWKGLYASKHKVQWSRANPDGWAVCLRVMELRKDA